MRVCGGFIRFIRVFRQQTRPHTPFGWGIDRRPGLTASGFCSRPPTRPRALSSPMLGKKTRIAQTHTNGSIGGPDGPIRENR